MITQICLASISLKKVELYIQTQFIWTMRLKWFATDRIWYTLWSMDIGHIPPWTKHKGHFFTIINVFLKRFTALHKSIFESAKIEPFQTNFCCIKHFNEYSWISYIYIYLKICDKGKEKMSYLEFDIRIKPSPNTSRSLTANTTRCTTTCHSSEQIPKNRKNGCAQIIIWNKLEDWISNTNLWSC